jgi:hypothetical protein
MIPRNFPGRISFAERAGSSRLSAGKIQPNFDVHILPDKRSVYVASFSITRNPRGTRDRWSSSTIVFAERNFSFRCEKQARGNVHPPLYIFENLTLLSPCPSRIIGE